MTDHVITHSDNTIPDKFTQDELDWLPWLEPVSVETLSEYQITALVDAARVKSAYFRLLARDPAILEARTRTDKDIFYNTRGGLPRAERELAATATSRRNGCIYCASVHSRFASVHSKRRDDVQSLLDEGIGVNIDERWNAIVAAATALTATPATFGPEHVKRLRLAGLDDLAISDLIHGTAFFNWANRLMLSLGEPQAATALPP
jgi:alkylhydroperoxidase domain protein